MTYNAYDIMTGSHRDSTRRSKHKDVSALPAFQVGVAEGNGALGGALGSLRIQGQCSSCRIPGKLSLFFIFS